MKALPKQGLSDQVRAVASKKYVRPALKSGRTNVSIRVKDLLQDLRAEGFPENHVPQICTALQGRKFQVENGLVIKDVQGPPSKMSTTVVITYSVEGAGRAGRTRTAQVVPVPLDETPHAKATRMLKSLQGVYKEKFAAYGGGEAFLRWVRGYDEEE